MRSSLKQTRIQFLHEMLATFRADLQELRTRVYQLQLRIETLTSQKQAEREEAEFADARGD